MANVTIKQPVLDRKNFMFVDQKDSILIKKPGELFGKNFKIKNLKNCKVYLLDHTTGIFVDDCDDCDFIIGPCNGSVFIRTSNRCNVFIISKQLRFRDCYDMNIYGYVPSDPVIESSDNFLFAPYNYKFPKLQELFISAKFNPSENKIERIYDFCPKEGETHFKWISGILKIHNLGSEILDFKEFGENEFPYNNYIEELVSIYGLELDESNNINEKQLIDNNLNFNSENKNLDNFFGEISFKDDSIKKISENTVNNELLNENLQIIQDIPTFDNYQSNTIVSENIKNENRADVYSINVIENLKNENYFETERQKYIDKTHNLNSISNVTQLSNNSQNINSSEIIESIPLNVSNFVDPEEVKIDLIIKNQMEINNKKIREKISYEMEQREIIRQKAIDFLNKFKE